MSDQQLPAPCTVVGAELPQRSVQLDVESHVTLQGAVVHVTLHCALDAHATTALAPTVKSQLDARQTMFAPSAAITPQLAPSMHVASHVASQLALHSAVVHWRWQPLAVALQPLSAVHPHERPSGHAQPLAEHAHCAAEHAGPFAE